MLLKLFIVGFFAVTSSETQEETDLKALIGNVFTNPARSEVPNEKPCNDGAGECVPYYLVRVSGVSKYFYKNLFIPAVRKWNDQHRRVRLAWHSFWRRWRVCWLLWTVLCYWWCVAAATTSTKHSSASKSRWTSDLTASLWIKKRWRYWIQNNWKHWRRVRIRRVRKRILFETTKLQLIFLLLHNLQDSHGW